MAQLLSPVCTDTLKFHSSSNFFCSTSSSRILARTNNPWSTTGGRGRRRGRRKLRSVSEDFASQASVADDYYAVLGLLPDATPAQVKKAYYECMKSCHPDLSGNDPDTTNFCIFINEVYEVLSDPVQRMVYDEIHGYALTATNPFLDDSSVKDLAFVDEFSCIGCKNCANVAPDVFSIEDDFGRARVCNQRGNPDLVQQAIDSCPVDCIHWTSAAQLSLLEDEMRRVERVNVALMLSGMGASSDVFRMASSRWEKRQSKVLTWAYEHFSLMGATYIKPNDEYNDVAMSRMCRWNTIGRGEHLDSDKMRYRNYFDNLKADDFTFQPWPRRTRPCPKIAFFRGCLAFIDNAMPYHPDRVLRQLGHTQRWPKKMPIPWIADKTYEAKSEKFIAHYPHDQDEWGAWENHVLTAEERGPKLLGGSKDSCSIEYTIQYKKFSHLLITNPRLRSEEKSGSAIPGMGEEPKADPNVVKAMGSLRKMDKLKLGEDVVTFAQNDGLFEDGACIRGSFRFKEI